MAANPAPGIVATTVLNEDDFERWRDLYHRAHQLTMQLNQSCFGAVDRNDYRNTEHGISCITQSRDHPCGMGVQ